MLGNIEAAVRYKLGITIIHINNSGFAGYGPGFWGPGQDPHTCTVSSSDVTNLSKVANALGLHSERIEKPSEIIPALKRALDENAKNRPAYVEFICSQYPIWSEFAGGPRRAPLATCSPAAAGATSSKLPHPRFGRFVMPDRDFNERRNKCLTSTPND